MDRLTAGLAAGDRFAGWPRAAALAVLAIFALLLALAAITAKPPEELNGTPGPIPASESGVAANKQARDADLALYRRIVERVAEGDGYYPTAIAEQRLRSYPVRPGLAVRMPTLALVTAWIGTRGMFALGVLVALAVMVAWWQRLASEPGALDRRVFALLLLAIGSLIDLKPQYLYQHEVWAGLLLALGFGLHRPGKWHGAWIAAALALAIREHALPFVMLMAALAGWRRDWRELGAWAVLVSLFAIGLTLHLYEVARHIFPSDQPSPPWLVVRGLQGWTGNIVASSVLWRLPHGLAAVVALLPLLGWAGWRSAAGLFGTLLHAGYGLLFMLAGRDNNFYWALVVIPTWFVGLAFMPRALVTLTRRALGKP